MDNNSSSSSSSISATSNNNASSATTTAYYAGGRVIASTNALGLGLDIPNIRLVVHILKIHSVEDYAQESGRGGRDGQDSEAVFIGPHTTSSSTTTSRITRVIEPRIEPNTAPYTAEDLTSNTVCVRRILDAVLDGDLRRAGCVEEAGEEAGEEAEPTL